MSKKEKVWILKKNLFGKIQPTKVVKEFAKENGYLYYLSKDAAKRVKV